MRSSFVKRKGLEETIQKVGEDLHSQYLLSFQPKDDAEGYRELKVMVRGCPECVVRHRPGYWRNPK